VTRSVAIERRKLQTVVVDVIRKNNEMMDLVISKLAKMDECESRLGELENVVGKREDSGLRLDVCDLKDSVNGNEKRKIIGLGAQLRALAENLKYYWNIARWFALGISLITLAMAGDHLRTLADAIQKR
jgi:hypothetical protein